MPIVPTKTGSLSWLREWPKINRTKDKARFDELRAGRPLPPAGFSKWTKARAVEWLNENLPILAASDITVVPDPPLPL